MLLVFRCNESQSNGLNGVSDHFGTLCIKELNIVLLVKTTVLKKIAKFAENYEQCSAYLFP